MERKRSHVSFTMLALLVALFSQNLLVLVVSVMSSSFEDQKNYYSTPVPDPSTATPPPSGSSPSSPHTSTPSHGSGSNGHGSRKPPSSHHGTPSPSHGGNNNNCGSPPSTTPSTPSSGGGYYNSPPSYGNNPPSSSSSPSPPITLTPPTTPPTDPGSPPFLPSPSPFTGTCNYWSTHPGIIWGVLGWWGTLGNAFGVTSIPGLSSGITLPQALTNTRSDGVGALLREGTASYLNSLVNNKFPYTTGEVRDRFVAALGSNKAAAAQARLFKMANEGRMKPRL